MFSPDPDVPNTLPNFARHALLPTLAALSIAACSDSEPSATDAGADAASDAGADAAVDAADGSAASDAGSGTDAEVPTPTVLDYPVDGEGPWNVGYHVFETTYDDPSTGLPRTIPVHVWYPTEDRRGEPAPYMGGLFPDEDSFVDATVAPPVNGTSYPTIVYSHGHQGFAGTSGFLMRAFAEQGWVAIAPDHVGNLLTSNELGDTLGHWVQRPMDILAALDFIAALPDTEPLALADVSRTVIFGHSRGSVNVWAAAGATWNTASLADRYEGETPALMALFEAGFTDARIVAGVALAGRYSEDNFTSDGWQQVSMPVLSLSGGEDGHDAFVSQWALITADWFSWAELAGGCHQTFALGGCETLDVPLGFSVVSTYSRAFARYHMLGDRSAQVVGILDGTIPVSEVVTYEPTHD